MPNSLTHRIAIDLLTHEQVLASAKAACAQLGWVLTAQQENGLQALTPSGVYGTGEMITLEVQGDIAIVTSTSQQDQHEYWDPNEQNIAALLQEMERLVRQLYFTPKPKRPAPEPVPADTQKDWSWYHVFIPSKGFFATPLLIDGNILIFLAMVFSGVDIVQPSVDHLVKWGANYTPLAMGEEPWRLLTSVFVHIGILHLLLNLFALFFIGILLEARLGTVRFLIAYLTCGLLASITSLLWHGVQISAGASGAIFGLYGVLLALLTTSLVEQDFRKSLLVSMSLFVGYNLIGGLKPGVDNAAHIGGLITGMVVGYAFWPGLASKTSHQ